MSLLNILARLPRLRERTGLALDRGAQRSGEAARGLQDSGVLSAGQGTVAESDRAKVAGTASARSWSRSGS